MTYCGIIACDNGQGHIRRCYLIALELVRRGCIVDLFAPKQKFEKFIPLFGSLHGLKNIDFSTRTSVRALGAGKLETLQWHRRLPCMAKYDVVISDNLPEILYIRPDAILSGHFFWHGAISYSIEAYQHQTKELLQHTNPIIVATDLFASNEVKSSKNYFPVGLYIQGKPKLATFKSGNLLISGGTTTAMHAELRRLTISLMKCGPHPFGNVFVDYSLLPEEIAENSEKLPRWMQIAKYNNVMYEQVTAAVCRPGIGTVTDLLQRGGRPFCVYEKNNNEVSHNAQTLEQEMVGEDCRSPYVGLQQASAFVVNSIAQKKHLDALLKLDFSGVSKTVNLVLSIK